MSFIKIQQCIDHVDQLNPTKSNELNIGVEIQDFARSQMLDGDWEEQIKRYKEKLKNFDGVISIHGPYIDLNPGSPDQKIGEVTKERYIHAIKIAKSINASYIVFHSQLNPALKDPKVKEIKVGRQVPFWEEMIKEIEDTNMVILLENFAEDDFKDLIMLVERINSPKVGVCLDLGHVLTNSQYGIAEWIKNLKSYIKYIHFHWNDGLFDAHNPPNEAYITEVFKILKENDIEPVLALEYDMDNLDKEVEKIRKNLL